MAKYYAGMETDAHCGRCKMETQHRILSITDGVPEKLICIGCSSIHKFKPPRVVVESRAGTRPSRPVKAIPRASSPSRFQEMMTTEQGGATAKPYGQGVAWEVGMWMDHPSFGLGKIQHRLGRKVDVMFKDGLKTLMAM